MKKKGWFKCINRFPLCKDSSNKNNRQHNKKSCSYSIRKIFSFDDSNFFPLIYMSEIIVYIIDGGLKIVNIRNEESNPIITNRDNMFNHFIISKIEYE